MTNLQHLQQLDNWQERYEAILEFGQELDELDSSYKTNQYRVVGCQSRVWLVLTWNNNLLQIKANADSRLVQGLLALVVSVYQDLTASQIIELSDNWVLDCGLSQNLSLVRRGGLNAVINRIMAFCKDGLKNTLNH